MKPNHQKSLPKRILITALILILLVVAVSGIYFFSTLRGIRHEGWKHPPRNPLGMFVSGEKRLEGTGAIEGWMTAEFVNHSFGLPPEYLRDTLHIWDPKYPRIPIDRLAKVSGFQRQDYLDMVRRAVDYYLSTQKQK